MDLLNAEAARYQTPWTGLRMCGSLLALHLTYVGFVGMLARELPVVDGARVADPGLRMAVRVALDKPLLPITEAEMRSVTELEALYYGIENLDGAWRALPNLQSIELNRRIGSCGMTFGEPKKHSPWWDTYIPRGLNKLPGQVVQRPQQID